MRVKIYLPVRFGPGEITAFIFGVFCGVTIWVSGFDKKSTEAQPSGFGSSSPAPRAAPLGELGASEFMSEQQWSSFVGQKSTPELHGLLASFQPEFWRSAIIGPSASYRIFGELGRREQDGNETLTTATNILSEAALGHREHQLLRFATIAVVQATPQLTLSAVFNSHESSLYPDLTYGIVVGEPSGNLSSDMDRFRAWTKDVAGPSSADQIQNAVIDGWIKRDAKEVLRWISSPEGSQYRERLPDVISAVCLGGVNDLSELLANNSTLNLADLAIACTRNGWNADAIMRFTQKLNTAQRQDFLIAYAKQLAQISPSSVAQFVNSADDSLFLPEVASALGPALMGVAPLLLIRLTSKLSPEARAKLADDLYYSANLSTHFEAASVYLQMRGMAGPSSKSALCDIGSKDLNQALTIIATMPASAQKSMREEVFDAAANLRAFEDSPVSDLLAFVNSARADERPIYAKSMAVALGRWNSEKCSEFLESNFRNDPTVWRAVFDGENGPHTSQLSTNDMAALLDKAIQGGISPEIYSIAATGLAAQIARSDIDAAQSSIESLDVPQAVKEQCRNAMVDVWAKADPLAAAAYVESLPPGESRDLAITSLLPNLQFARDEQEKLVSLASSSVAQEHFSSIVHPVPKANP